MNDQMLALTRTIWQSVITSVIAFALSKGIEIDSAAAFAVTWPVVMAAYYFIASWLGRKFSQTRLLMGPGDAPIYLPPAALEELLRND